MQKDFQKSEAVSPVVGVMLMLVVTIIIAAVVSGFAGGLGQSSSKAPQLSIGIEAHSDQYIIVDFKGGDTVSGSAIILKTFIPMGLNKDMSNKVDLTKVIYLPENSVGLTSHTLQTGDKIKINWTDAFAVTSYGPMAPSIGEPVNIEIYDSVSGKMIVTAQTTVLP
ncbi:MAG: hypothetical protein A4E36_00142 [Methanoregulaceae archaeon PtaB.Bin009]|nr:MAG: hypothetical protein A4E36_00142 [Methanoregulaceae archaeon PtaB.Bin009]